MNLSQIDEVSDGEDAEYLRVATRRLARILPSPLTDIQRIALMQIITIYTFVFADGFVLNDMKDTSRMIGIQDAAAIVACFAAKNDDRDWRWWKGEYSVADKESPTYDSIHSELLAHIVKNSAVRQTLV